MQGGTGYQSFLKYLFHLRMVYLQDEMEHRPMSGCEIKNFEQLQTEISERYPTLSQKLQQVAGYACENPESVALSNGC